MTTRANKRGRNPNSFFFTALKLSEKKMLRQRLSVIWAVLYSCILRCSALSVCLIGWGRENLRSPRVEGLNNAFVLSCSRAVVLYRHIGEYIRTDSVPKVSRSINTMTFADGAWEGRSRSEEEVMQGHRRRRATLRSPATPISPKGGGGTASILAFLNTRDHTRRKI